MYRFASNRYNDRIMMSLQTTRQRRGAALSIKKEIKDFIVATEHLYRLLSNRKTLTCHEAEIVRCCLEELSAIERNPSEHNGSTGARRHGFE